MTPCSSPSSIACCALLCPKNFLLQRSPHSFRAIFASLLRALQLDQFHFISVQCKDRWSNNSLDAVSKHGRDHWEGSLVLCADRTHLFDTEHCGVQLSANPNPAACLLWPAGPRHVGFAIRRRVSRTPPSLIDTNILLNFSRIATEAEKQFNSFVSPLSCRFWRFVPVVFSLVVFWFRQFVPMVSLCCWSQKISAVRVHGVSICCLMLFVVNLEFLTLSGSRWTVLFSTPHIFLYTCASATSQNISVDVFSTPRRGFPPNLWLLHNHSCSSASVS